MDCLSAGPRRTRDLRSISIPSTGREAVNLTNTTEISETSPTFSPDGKLLAISYKPKTSPTPDIVVLDWQTQWEAEGGQFAPAGGTFTYLLNKDGRTAIYLARTDSGHHDQIQFAEGPTFLSGNSTPFSPEGDRLLVSRQSLRRPSNVWVYDLGSKHATSLRSPAIASLDPANLPPSQLVHYKSFDGKVISAFVWMPFNLQPNRAAPGPH